MQHHSQQHQKNIPLTDYTFSFYYVFHKILLSHSKHAVLNQTYETSSPEHEPDTTALLLKQ